MPQNNQTNTTKKQSSAAILIKIISSAKLIRDDAKQTYAVGLIPGKNNGVTPIFSADFLGWLRNSYFIQCSNFPSKNDLANALEHADYLTKQGPSVGNIHFRFGCNMGNHYIAMCDNAEQVIEITRKKWDIIQNSPIYFRQYDTQRALPTPVKGGSLKSILNYFNIANEEDEIILLSTICTLPLANLTRPILGFIGQQGSAKTSTARLIRALLDPSDPAENDFSPTKQNISLVFYHNAIPIFDNLSTISSTVSDMFCRAYSGTGFQSRKLYMDYALISFSYKRSFLFTAINTPTAAEDFNARTVMIQMNRIAGSAQIGEESIMRKFKADAPNILGGMLDVLVEAKRIAPGLNLHWKPRWADAFQHAAAAAEVLGYGANRYLEACRSNIAARATPQGSSQLAVYSKQEPALEAILSLMSEQGNFTGTTSDLLLSIAPHCPSNLGPAALKKWPDSAEKLGLALNRIKAALEDADVTLSKTV